MKNLPMDFQAFLQFHAMIILEMMVRLGFGLTLFLKLVIASNNFLRVILYEVHDFVVVPEGLGASIPCGAATLEVLLVCKGMNSKMSHYLLTQFWLKAWLLGRTVRSKLAMRSVTSRLRY
ncbi:hypothetical protein AKJ16_DCAP09103 [Drosera capensis]